MTSANLFKLRSLIEEGQLNDAAWVWFSADGSDRLFGRLLSDKYSSGTYAVLSDQGMKLFVSELDGDIDSGIEKIVFKDSSEVSGLLKNEFDAIGWPSAIYLNYSSSGDHKVDSLGHGLFLVLTKKIADIYEERGKCIPQYLSAEHLIYAVLEKKTEVQIERMRIAAARALEILRDAFSNIKVGMSERDIYDLVQSCTLSSRADFCATANIIKEEYSWEEAACPIILVGPNLQKGGHAETSDYVLQKGQTVYADFGLKLTFEDGIVVSSDIQRMAYVLKDGEEIAPPAVQDVFDTLHSAISKGMKAIRPGMHGYEIDEIVRSEILAKGFPNYNHSTGHPIGEVAHSPGALIGPKGNPRSAMIIQNNAVYTIEPRCQVANGGSVEEMVLVTPEGGKPLCEPQSTLWLLEGDPSRGIVPPSPRSTAWPEERRVSEPQQDQEDQQQRDVLERWKTEATSHCAPLFIQDALLGGGHDATTRNATATFITQGGKYYACTCRHAVEIVKKRREVGWSPFPTLALPLPKGFLNLAFFSAEGLKDSIFPIEGGKGEEHLDLAIADISPSWGVFNGMGKIAIDMNAGSWREPRWSRAEMLAAGGFPEDRKRNVTREDGAERVFGTFTFIIADQSGGIARRDRIVLMKSTLANAHGWFFSGVSGGPMYVLQDELMIPIGLIFEGWPQSKDTRPHQELTDKDIMVRGLTLTPENFERWLAAKQKN